MVVFSLYASLASSDALVPAFHLSIAVCACPCAHSTVPAKESSAPAAFSKASAALNHFGGSIDTESRNASAACPFRADESTPLSPPPTLSNEPCNLRRWVAVDRISDGLP